MPSLHGGWIVIGHGDLVLGYKVAKNGKAVSPWSAPQASLPLALFVLFYLRKIASKPYCLTSIKTIALAKIRS